jgi:RecG-like helicase
MKENNPPLGSTVELLAASRSASILRTLLVIFVLAGLVITAVPVSAAVRAVPVLPSDLSSIDASITGTTVEVKASIKSITPPQEGRRAPVRLTLFDEKATITLIIWPDVWEPLNKQYNLSVGDAIGIRALVTEYRGKVQLTLKDVTDFQITSKAPANASAPEAPVAVNSNASLIAKSSTPQPEGVTNDAHAPSSTTAATLLSTVTLSMKGQEIVVQGSVTAVHEPTADRAPYIVTLSDGPTNVKLVYWKNIQAEVGPKIHMGNTVRAKVTVGEYHNALELRLSDAQGVQVVIPPTEK